MVGNPQSHHRHWTDFPVGARVRTVCATQDFRYFPARGLTGTVSKNEGRYLSIVVEFDPPHRLFDNGISAPMVERSFNFNPSDLLLESEEATPDTVRLESEWADMGGDDPFRSGYWTRHNEQVPQPDGSLTPGVITPVACPKCGEHEVVKLPEGWSRLKANGWALPEIGCRDPWHFVNVVRW